ncbi:putative NAD(P)/FAD-binding protein YdhS [Arthrobacter sp. V4I6]|uniref:FAD/NAD(P)-binding protein n=1 Tax=unclassified Arthrobacter TaxID=235627 RepID=UPI0027846335|nr:MULTISPECIES: FAD/NAD(P)-binding protein [unclassified Arthrobacter]MDQ0823251.1 putative NAD(P)/FAD-binding protein YdhS [Arthrobacter sp. V1I7]MDQ0852882.1 putative NAD(P)/FAD-binding protein YdhS [Arthrobacter sp. V4I6]
MPATPPSVVFVGGGPRAAGILERLAANRPELFTGRLDIHVVEPYAAGSGRIWRFEQHPGLMLNSAAADVTMFTDASVLCDGPAAEGPALADWAAGVLDGSIPDVPDFPAALRRQLKELSGSAFPTRQLQSRYLEWFFRRAVAQLAPDGAVTVYQDVAVAIEPAPPSAGNDGAGYAVRLAAGTQLRADVVVSALGHTDSLPGAQSAAWADFAARHGGFHAPPSYTTDVDYSRIRAGQDVIVAGMGLAFVDLLVLLMEGRGGRFEDAPDGGLRYLPSGAEPRIWAGSRRGVPYHSKISSALRGDPVGPPRFFTAEAVEELLAEHGELDFRTQLWPLIAKDAGYGYYRELFTGYPERVSTSWDDFAGRFAAADWYSQERRRLVSASVPDPGLHLDLEQLDRPFAGRSFAGADDVQDAVAAYIERDLRLRTSADHSETLALFTALLKVYMELGRLVPPARLNARSQQHIHGWWHGFFSFVDSGPPPRRLREMLALHRAGVLRFLGPGLEVTADEASGLFVASSTPSGITLSATAFIEARLPAPSVASSANPLLRQMHRSGTGVDQELLSADGLHSTGRLLVSEHNELLNPVGDRQLRLFGVGPATSGWGAGAFARPGTNAAPFRENDALARRILTILAGDRAHRPAPETPSETTSPAAVSGKAWP